MIRLVFLTVLLLVKASTGLHYIHDIGYPVVNDYSPTTILVQVVPRTAEAILQITCSDGDAPTDVTISNADTPGNSKIVVDKNEESINVTQSIHGRRFRFYVTVTCRHAHITPVLQFHHYEEGVYLLSQCRAQDHPATSWVRAWAQIQHSSSSLMNPDDEIVARLKPRQMEIPNHGNYMQVWDTLEVMLSGKIINHVHLTLGCVHVEQPQGINVRIETDEQPFDPAVNNEGDAGDSIDGVPDEELTPEVPLTPQRKCGTPPVVNGCPDLVVPCGYVFFPSQTYAGFNLGKYHGSDISVLAQYCSSTSCVAFNSDGWYKRVVPAMTEWQPHGGPCEGTYVKEEHAPANGDI